MASRRVRIKGIANIPQRKKPTDETNVITQQIACKNNNDIVAANTERSTASNRNNTRIISDNSCTTDSKETFVTEPLTNENLLEEPTKESKNIEPMTAATAENGIKTNVTDETISVNEQKKENTTTTPVKQVVDKIKIRQETTFVKADAKNGENLSHGMNEIKTKPTRDNEIKKPPSRRRFIKPTISSTAISRIKSKPAECPEDINSNKIDSKLARTENIDSSPAINGDTCDLKNNEANDSDRREGVNINLNEIVLPACTGVTEESSDKAIDIIRLPKPQYIDGTKSGSDTEYPPPAASPNKFVNRPRIKAVPRLGQQRRTSFSIGSASESEDDTRKTYNRNRNDSVCSAISGSGDLPSAESLSPQKKEYSTIIQRKCRRTEQTRKLAEARRDFLMKFGSNKPDRQRLTMIDLIFYNPATAPMSQKKKRNDTTTTETESVKDPDEPPDDNEDKEDKEETTKEASDEENTVPAPQIIIGANGEIVIDEKSLVIESKATVEGREALKQSQIVNGDFDTGYGIYKRFKRSKDWSKDETLRFYKALNTIGTDFTMMCELFPGRNRRELKLKFKKEERMNKNLVDRAVMQPVQFDMTDLRREVEVAEIEKQEAERLKKEKEQLLSERANNIKRKRGKCSLGGHIQIMEPEVKPEIRRPAKKKIKKLSSRQEVIKNGINSIIDSDSDSSISTTQSVQTRTADSDSESGEEAEETNVHKRIQTTRSGRISRPRQQSTIENGVTNETTTVEEEESLTPGSLMILTDTDKKGEMIYKFYTVDENGEQVPIDLSPDILENLTRNLPDLNSTNNDLETNDEENVEMELPSENTIANMTVSDLPSFSILNESDLIIDEDSMIIPFEELDSNLLNDSENRIPEQTSVKV